MHPAIFSISLKINQVVTVLDILPILRGKATVPPEQVCDVLPVMLGRIFQTVDLCRAFQKLIYAMLSSGINSNWTLCKTQTRRTVSFELCFELLEECLSLWIISGIVRLPTCEIYLCGRF